MGLVCKRTCSKISRQRKAYDQAVKHSFKSCMHHSKLHVDSMSQTSSVYMQSNACIAACGTLSPHNKLAVCVCAERQHAEQAGGNGGGCAQAAAARLQEGHAEAAAGTCLAHLCISNACVVPFLRTNSFHIFIQSLLTPRPLSSGMLSAE